MPLTKYICETTAKSRLSFKEWETTSLHLSTNHTSPLAIHPQNHNLNNRKMSDYPARPQTPQAMLHRLPDKPDPSSSADNARRPTKYIILIMASTAIAGKVQISKSVATALSCPLFQGDSLHETSAKAASVGAARRPACFPAEGDEQSGSGSGANEERYQRMWLSKMTRTGYLFPEESRPAVSNEGFSGFSGVGGGEGSPSTSTSRRGSVSSIASSSAASDAAVSTASSSMGSAASSFMSSGALTTNFVNRPPAFTLSDEEKARKANKALMIVTHPELEGWHRGVIRRAVGEYGIGVIFVPLGGEEEEGELPVLKPLDPRSMTSFGTFGDVKKMVGKSLDEEIMLRVDGGGSVEDIIEDIVSGVNEIMSV